jgi:integrase
MADGDIHPFARKRKPRSIYVARAEADFVKIGITASPLKRLNAVRNGTHASISIAYVASVTGDAGVLERDVHAALKQHRISGEWFKVTSDKAVDAILAAANKLGYPLETTAPDLGPKRNSKHLTANQIERAGPGRYGDGRGLSLIVASADSKKWIYRFTWNHKPTEMGLGSALAVTLKEARENAHDARRLVAQGINPIIARREGRKPKVLTPTFGKCALELIAAKRSEWRSAVHREQWRVTLETFCAPIWNTPVDAIDTAAALGVLQPVWQKTPETASRLRGRIEAVLDAARAKGHIAPNEANPARWKGHLDHLLAKRTRLSRGHHAAMAYKDVPAFIDALSDSPQALALEFLILTAARLGEVLGARWAEIDLAAKVWTIPGARMKAGREHRVPLTGRAVEILERLSEVKCSQFVFPGRHGPLSRSAVVEIVPPGATIHDFRSSFRDWCGNETSVPREIAEQALAHATGDSTERAYRRGDALEKRRLLMDAWAQFCGGATAGNVIQYRRQAATNNS